MTFFKDYRFNETIKYYVKPFIFKLTAFIITILNFFWIIKLYWWLHLINLMFGIVLFVVLLSSSFCKAIRYCYKCLEHDNELKNGFCYLYAGQPSAGKTLSLTYDGTYIAEQNWFELQEDYFTLKNKEIIDSTELSIYNNICESYNYYKQKENECIPCLVSNFGIVDNFGRYSYKFDNLDFFLQNKKMPERTSILITELASVISNKLSTCKKEELPCVNALQLIDDSCSKYVHFTNSNILADEQDASESYLGYRRIIYRNRWLENREEVLKPQKYKKKLYKLVSKILKNQICTEKQYIKYAFYKQKINDIGFHKIEYLDRNSTVAGNEKESRGFYYLACKSKYKYARRSCFNDYLAKNKKIMLKSHSSMYSE